MVSMVVSRFVFSFTDYFSQIPNGFAECHSNRRNNKSTEQREINEALQQHESMEAKQNGKNSNIVLAFSVEN